MDDIEDKMNIYRVKGAPQKTINEHGTERFLVDVQLFEDVYHGKSVPVKFSTLKKSLFTEHTQITCHDVTRIVRQNCEYHEYK